MSGRSAIGRGMEILLVEDDYADARFTTLALRQGGIKHRLTLVVDGEEALDFLFRRDRFTHAPQPNLVLLDLGLPKLDGREVLAGMKADEGLCKIPVVVMTASAEHEEILRDEGLEVAAFVTKPVDWPKFLQLVRELRHYWQADFLAEMSATLPGDTIS